jgi:hypothetical protein
MIFHTAAEKNYYNAFFKRWHKSIKTCYPNAVFSLKYVGDIEQTDVLAFCQKNNINLVLDPTTKEDLIAKHGSMDIGRGYYPMSRWNSIPVVKNKDVCVTDVDVIMIKNDVAEIKEYLKENEFVSISRNKNPKINLMMVNYIRYDACQRVKDVAVSLMNNKDFRWDIDLEVMSYMRKNLKYIYLHRLIKFDSSAGLVPKIYPDTSFGYYSAVSIILDGIRYNSGLDAKTAKYEYADRKQIFKFATN